MVREPRNVPLMTVNVLLLAGMAVLLVGLNGGRPQSVWFYPYMVALAAFVVSRPATVRRVHWQKGELGPVNPLNVALGHAIARGFAVGLMLFLMFRLGYWERSDGFLVSGMALWTGADEYRYRRGLKFTWWTAVAGMMFALLAQVVLIDVLKVVPRG